MSIVIVSADEEASTALSRALERIGVPFKRAVDSKTAKAQIADQIPHVVVLDAVLSGAVEVVHDARQHAPWLRAVIVRGATDPQISGFPVVTKPFDAGELAAMLAREDRVAIFMQQTMLAEQRAEELSQIVETSLEAMIGVALDGTIQAWNSSASRIYGFSTEEALGHSIRALLGDADLVARGPREAKRRTKDGKEIVCVVSISPLFDRNGRLSAVAELSLDVSELRKLQRELEHVERLASLGRFAATLAHEINNGLAVMQFGIAFGLERAVALGDQTLVEAMTEAQAAAETTAQFVKQVSSFGRKDPPKLERAPLDATVKVAAGMVRARAKARSIALTIDPCDLTVVHDPSRIAQALMNLMANAIDAAKKDVHVRVVKRAGFTDILVEDDGAGIDPAALEKVFDPFFTTKEAGQGTGIGLPVVRQIADLHQGTIELVPRKLGGTVAVLSLPDKK